MSPFAETIQAWQGFYTLAGTAAATLVGLLFIAVSLHLDMFTGTSSRDMSTLAEHTLTNFFSILMISLFFLIPHQTPLGLGLPLLAVVLVDMIREVRGWFQRGSGQRMPDHQGQFAQLYGLLRILFPVLYDLTMLFVAITVLLGRDDTLEWLVWVIIFLLIRASLNAWNMMIRLSVVRKGP